MGIRQSIPYRLARGWWQRGFAPLALNPFLEFVPPGHFYSPIPSQGDVDRGLAVADRVTMAGIDLRESAQLDLIQTLSGFMPTPFGDAPTDRYRFGYRNPYFSYADGTTLYAMLRWLKPRRVVEVGSGYSSALMLDTADERAWPVEFLFIEPYPERLNGLLRTSDVSHEVLTVPVQDVPLSRFSALDAGDIIFIDSSHVAKVGSDVLWLLYTVLPAVPAGVVIQIHDIFWPFEYPEVWLRGGRAWNEAYFVRAFLQFNSVFEILWFTSYLTTCHRERVAAKMPLLLRDHGGSLWLRKCA